VAIIVVNRVKYDASADHRPRMREIAAIAKRHGAVSMRAGRCIAGPYTGQVVSAITFPDGAGFGRGRWTRCSPTPNTRGLSPRW